MDQEFERRLKTLEMNDERKNQHYTGLKNDIASLREGQREIVLLLAGSSLNGNKGFVKIMEIVEAKVDEMEKTLQGNCKDINNYNKIGWIVISGLILTALKVFFGNHNG